MGTVSQQPVIMWFRDDLRLSDNQALYEAAKGSEIIPVYIYGISTIHKAMQAW